MTTITHYYRVAGFWMSVSLPETCDANALLPSFRPFRHESCGDSAMLFNCTVCLQPDGEPDGTPGAVIEETENDMGYIRLYARPRGYGVHLSVEPGGLLHTMRACSDFSDVSIRLCPGDGAAGRMLSSLLRIAYSQAILYHEALSIHASAVYLEGRAFLFMGKSGTGKSTHSSLWMKHIPGTGLLNDDNPTVRIVGGKAYACGTPWSGKTPCYKDLFFPIGGMARLHQAAENRYCAQEGADAFVALFPGCSAICSDGGLRRRLYDTLSSLAGMVPVGLLGCRPDREAALLCHKALHEAYETMRNQ